MRIGHFTAATVAAALAGAATPAAAQDWTQQVQSLIKANYSYPRSAEIRREQGRSVLRITLAASGAIQNVELAQSSGSAILDREAIRIAQKIGKLPPPPKGAGSVMIPIVWRLS